MTVPSTSRATADPASVLAGGGEMGALMRAIDWSQTPLGPLDRWSPSLRTMVRILLVNRFPMLLWWGPRHCQLYNDAYRPVLGSKHPRSMGQPGQECWPEIWHIIEPLLEAPYQGGPATWDDDLFLEVNRHGFTEETHFTIAYSPVPDEGAPNGVGGVLATVHEITQQVIQERRVVALRDLGSRSSEAKTAAEACRIAAEAFGRHPKDVPFALLYLIDDDRLTARLAGAAGVAMGERASPHAISLAADDDGAPVWPLGAVMRDEAPRLVERLAQRFGAAPAGPWDDPPNQALVLPVPSNIQHRLAGFLVLGVSARLALDDFYRGFCELATAQVATAIANARAYEEERARAEALAELDRAKTAFFSNVSHEFRTPLTLLLGPLAETLAGAHGDLTAEQHGELAIVHRNGLRLLRLVNTLLDFSRIEAQRVEAVYTPVDLPALTADLAGVFRSAIEHAGLRLVVDAPPLPEGMTVYVDQEMWEKIVLNLLSNAFKFTLDGEISVALRPSGDGRSVELTVADTGTGIPAAELPRLFERFHRVRGMAARTHEGTGIGLALVQELVKLHGGAVRAESVEGRGSVFTVSIPVGAGHLPPERVGAARAPAPLASGAALYVEEAQRWLPDGDEGMGRSTAPGASSPHRLIPPSPPRPVVLLADDNADMRAYVGRLLGERYRVMSVADGEAALATIRAAPPDLVLADVMMPGLDGFGLLRAVRADSRTATVPIILLSARAGEESRVDGLAAGADDYLVKPFSARELLARVRAHLELTRLRAAAEAERRRLRQVLDVLPAAVTIVDADGRYTMINPALRELLGIDVTGWRMPTAEAGAYEAYGARRLDGSPYPSTDLPLQRAVLRGETVLGARFLVRHQPSGRDVPVLANSAPLFDAAGVQAGGVVILQDMTAIHDLEQQKDAFLSATSHDLQQPVALISGYAQLLHRRLTRDAAPDRDWLLATVANVEEAVGRLSEQIRELLDASRLQLGRPLELHRTPTDLVALARQAVAAYEEAGDGRRWRITAGAPSVVGAFDAARLRRVLDNLLSNAAKYGAPADEIEVSVYPETREGEQWAVLTVRDHGIGIPAADLPRIFERFYRAGNVADRVAGAGIGLTGARQIVEQHGGSIQVRSVEGQGSAFIVRLPLTSPEAGPSEA